MNMTIHDQDWRVLRVAGAYLALLLSLPLSTWLHAGDEDDMAELMAILDSETELATRSKMNADFVPGMVSVLQGDDLRQLGARNAAEALNRVPGLYVTEGNSGKYRVVARGVGASLRGSNIKVLLDGLPVNNAVTGSADAVLRIPAEQIERIVVVRGPGSALYGEYALNGVVDIVLRHDVSQFGAGVGSDDFRQGHFIVSEGNEDGLQFNANGSVWHRNETGRSTGDDNFSSNPMTPRGNAPGEMDDNFSGSLLRTGFNLRGYQFNTLFLESKLGEYSGDNGVAAFDPAPAVEKNVGAEFLHSWTLSESLELGLTASTLHTWIDTTPQLGIPAGVTPPGAPGPLPADVYREDTHQSRQSRAELRATYQLAESNTLLLGAAYAEATVLQAGGRRLLYGIDEVSLTPTQTLVVEGAERAVRSVFLQDQWRPVNALEFTLGVRHDDYDDWGSSVSPRLAAVWRLSDAHLIKAQYAEAFRPPTLEESYPGPDLYGMGFTSDVTAEELQSSELSYIYHHGGRVARLTLFHTDITDLIEFVQIPGQPPSYRNRGGIKSRGGELEWEQYFGRDWKLLSNLSYVDAMDTARDEELVGAVNWLGNVGLIWEARANLVIGGRVRYVGEQNGWGPGIGARQAEEFDDYTTLDLTLTRNNALQTRGLSLHAGASNLLVEKYRTVPDRPQFPDGLTGQDADWWMGFSYQFDAR